MPADSEVKVEPEKDLYIWRAPARPFKRRDREFYVTIIAIVGIVGLILFLVEGWMPVMLLISLIFLFYVLNTVEPEIIEYKITNRGVKIADKVTSKDILLRFWFSRRFDSQLLVFQTQVLPGRLELVINKEDIEKIRQILKKDLNEEEAPPSFLDKTANWMVKKLPNNK